MKITDPTSIANEFNDYFTKVAEEITKKIRKTEKSPLSFLSHLNPTSFFTYPCTPKEVSSVIQSLHFGKSFGPNSIPIKLLKILDHPISVDL